MQNWNLSYFVIFGRSILKLQWFFPPTFARNFQRLEPHHKILAASSHQQPSLWLQQSWKWKMGVSWCISNIDFLSFGKGSFPLFSMHYGRFWVFWITECHKENYAVSVCKLQHGLHSRSNVSPPRRQNLKPLPQTKQLAKLSGYLHQAKNVRKPCIPNPRFPTAVRMSSAKRRRKGLHRMGLLILRHLQTLATQYHCRHHKI